MKIPDEALRLMQQGVTVTEATRAIQRSRLSTRSRVLCEANRRGKWFGIASRVGGRMTRAEAKLLAAESAKGDDVYYHCAVPERWRHLFMNQFVRSALYAAHTTRSVSARSE